MILGIAAPLFGVILEVVVMRGLRGTTDTVKLVVSISLLLFMIGLAQLIWKPGVSRPMAKFFQSNTPIDLGPTTITWHQAITIGVAIAVAIGLRIVLTRFRFGIAMRAAVDDPSLSALNGARPNRVSMLAWALGTALAALGGILIAPNVTLDAPSLSLLIVSAYAAAIFGRLRSLPLTFVGAIVIGLTEGYLTGYLPQNPYLPGLRIASPAILLFLVLLILPNPRLRGRMARSREFFPMPSWRGALIFAGVVVFGGVVMMTTLSTPDQLTYGRLFPIGIVALSLVPLVGLRRPDLAVPAELRRHRWSRDGPPRPRRRSRSRSSGRCSIAAAVGALIALPALRLSGIYLALGTAAFAVVLDKWILTLPKFAVFGLFDVDLFTQGSIGVDPLKLFGITYTDPGSQMVIGAVAFALVVARRRRDPARPARPPAHRDEGQRGRVRDARHEPVRHQARSCSRSRPASPGSAAACTRSSSPPIQAGNFDLVSSLQVFALTVVGGIGAVGGALFAGISLYVVLPLLTTLVTPYWSDAVIGSACSPVVPASALGRNPNGAVQRHARGLRPARGLAVVAAGDGRRDPRRLRSAARRRDRQLDVRRVPRGDPAGRVDRGHALGRRRAADARPASTTIPPRPRSSGSASTGPGTTTT